MRLCHQCGNETNDGARFCASCGAVLLKESGASTDPLVGRTIGGSYSLQEIVGVGGMGRVYRAEQSTLGRTVAIKVIHPHLLGDDQTVARFYTEARASSRLNHPNSVSIIDFGRTDDGILYLAMEFLNGKDLAMIMHEEGPIPFKRSCDILIEVLSALEEAHVNDIVHRDLKPENIILRRMTSGRDLVKVVDFGLATIVGSNSTSITRPGLVCGTPDYMSPEQGRGEQVDGRGDLYALGVVLFELLADQLPFDDETPTKVVLRHINDPVPDPREVAPHRGIPDELANICIHALQKRREERFQSAREMSNAIRAARESLDAKRSDLVECSNCGTDNPSQMRFCGSCGGRLEDKSLPRPTPAMPLQRASFYPLSDNNRPLVGRQRALDALAAACQGVGVRTICVHGEPGIGKSRFLQEAAKYLALQGDFVVGAGPHPLGAPVPYVAVRQLVTDLLQVPESDLDALKSDATMFIDPLARAGIAELANPEGLPGPFVQSRSAAVARALRATIDLATERFDAPRVALLVDDYDECDQLSREVLSRLGSESDTPVTIIVASHSPKDARHHIELTGLTQSEAERFLAKKGTVEDDETPTTRHFLPLYLEQLERLGAKSPVDDAYPSRLADVVSQRFDRLQVPARRLLQALAVFGGRASFEELRQIVTDDELRAGDELSQHGFVAIQGGGVEINHPFVSRLVEAFIPAEARKELHRQVQRIVSDRSAPLEVIAEHAYRSGEPMRALMTLERMGDAATDRGDHSTAVLAFSRALDLARREMLESGDAVMDTAIVTFSRKLAWALALGGDLARADGVVREVLDLTGPSSLARARMYVVLGRISRLRERHREAMRMFGQALELVAGEDNATELELQMAIGEMRLSDNDGPGAANAFRRALELSAAEPVQHLLAQFQLVEALLLEGDIEPTRPEAELAMTLATNHGSESLIGRAQGLLGLLAKASGDELEAKERFRAAVTFASTAGDVYGVQRWRREL